MAKNKIFTGMSKVAIAAVIASSLGGVSSAFAAENDIYNKDGENLGDISNIILNNKGELFKIIKNLSSYTYEVNGNLYKAGEIDGLLKEGATTDNLGQAVVDKGLESQGQAPTEKVEVASVSPSTTTILPAANVNTDTYKLALNYLDKDGNSISADKLASDLKVSFVDNLEVFNADGTIKTKANIPAASGKITVVANVTSESQKINISKEFTVNVVTATDYAKVTDSKMVFNTDVNGSVIAVGDVASLVPTVAVLNDGKELKDDTAPADWNGNVKSVTSSDIKVLTVNTNATNVNLVPVSAGTATITVELNSGYKYTKTIEVKAEARKASAIKTDKEKLTLSSTVSTGSAKTTVLDQYGDPVKGAIVYAYPAKTGEEAILDQAQTSATNEKGEASLTVAAVAGATTGNDTVKLSVDADSTKDGIGTLAVEYAKAGEVASYGIRIASGSVSDDATIDKYNSKDNSLSLEFIGKDSNGVVAKVYDQTEVGSKYSVTSSDKTIATATVDGTGKIVVNAVKAGTATITVKEGNITRASYSVTVTDSTPAVGSIELVKDAKLTVSKSASVTIDDTLIAKLVKVGDYKLAYNSTTKVFDVKDGTNVIGSVELISSDTEKAAVNGNVITTTGSLEENSSTSLLFRLKDTAGNIKEVASLALTVDNAKPTVKSVKGSEVGKVAASKAFTTNTGLTATATDKGAAGNSLKVAIADTKNDNATVEVSVDAQNNTITIDPANDSGNAIESKLEDIVAAVNTNSDASALVNLSVADANKTAPAQAEAAITLENGSNELTFNVTFSEAVDATTAGTVGNYTYETVNPDTATLSEDGKTVTLKINAFEDATKVLNPGTSTIAIENVTDLTGNAMDSASSITISAM